MLERLKAMPSGEFEIEFALPGYRWDGADAEGLPIVQNPDGTVCEMLLRFFGWSLKSKRTKISSMKGEAYILRDWFIYLRSIDCSHLEVDDSTMSEWRNIQIAKANEDGDPIRSVARVQRKLSVVFTFYDKLKEATLGTFDFVSPLGPITSRERPRVSKKSKGSHESGTERTWLSADRASHSRKRRKTPDKKVVLAVLSHLRQSASHSNLCDRNWLIGRTMSDCGLRSEEVARLGIRALETALAQEGIKAARRTWANGGRRVRLDEFDGGSGDRDLILDGLRRLKRKHNENIYVVVKGKGDVERAAPFSIDYVIDLLDNYVWSGRQEALRSKDILDPPDQIFLSHRTAKPLTKEAIGNLLKSAFTEVGIPLSGHRLRAYFATVLADRLWAELYAANGFRWDQTVENMVMDKVAEALGHASVNTTVKHYVNIAQLKYFGMSGKGNLPDLRSAAGVFAKYHKDLSGGQIRKLMQIVERVAVKVEGLEDLLDSILAHPDYAMRQAPAALTEPTARSVSQCHSLRIVSKTG